MTIRPDVRTTNCRPGAPTRRPMRLIGAILRPLGYCLLFIGYALLVLSLAVLYTIEDNLNPRYQMKTLLALIALTALTLTARAAEETYFNPISVFTGVTVASQDLNSGQLGTRVGLRYYLNNNWGVQAAADTRYLKRDYNVSGALLFRLPTGKASLDFELGPTYAIDRERWGAVLLVGPTYHWSKYIETSLKTGARKWFGSAGHIESLTTLELGLNF